MIRRRRSRDGGGIRIKKVKSERIKTAVTISFPLAKEQSCLALLFDKGQSRPVKVEEITCRIVCVNQIVKYVFFSSLFFLEIFSVDECLSSWMLMIV